MVCGLSAKLVDLERTQLGQLDAHAHALTEVVARCWPNGLSTPLLTAGLDKAWVGSRGLDAGIQLRKAGVGDGEIRFAMSDGLIGPGRSWSAWFNVRRIPGAIK